MAFHMYACVRVGVLLSFRVSAEEVLCSDIQPASPYECYHQLNALHGAGSTKTSREVTIHRGWNWEECQARSNNLNICLGADAQVGVEGVASATISFEGCAGTEVTSEVCGSTEASQETTKTYEIEYEGSAGYIKYACSVGKQYIVQALPHNITVSGVCWENRFLNGYYRFVGTTTWETDGNELTSPIYVNNHSAKNATTGKWISSYLFYVPECKEWYIELSAPEDENDPWVHIKRKRDFAILCVFADNFNGFRPWASHEFASSASPPLGTYEWNTKVCGKTDVSVYETQKFPIGSLVQVNVNVPKTYWGSLGHKNEYVSTGDVGEIVESSLDSEMVLARFKSCTTPFTLWVGTIVAHAKTFKYFFEPSTRPNRICVRPQDFTGDFGCPGVPCEEPHQTMKKLLPMTEVSECSEIPEPTDADDAVMCNYSSLTWALLFFVQQMMRFDM